MIYFDNAATTLHKPAEVAEAVKEAILTLGNASRGAHEAALSGMRSLYAAREMLCELFHGGRSGADGLYPEFHHGAEYRHSGSLLVGRPRDHNGAGA